MGFTIGKNIIDLGEAQKLAKNETLNFNLYEGGTLIFSGLLKNKPKFAISAEYDRLINFDAAFGTLNKIGYFAGKSFGTSQTWTRKIFKGGSYLSVDLQTRIVDDGVTNVIEEASKLARLCSPLNLADGGDIADVKKNAERNITHAYGLEKYGKQNDKDVTIKDPNIVKDMLFGLLDGSLNNSPPIMTLKISNFFVLDGFYAKSIDFEYSHEQTASGPLYADVNISLENRDIRKSADLGKAFAYRRGTNGKGAIEEVQMVKVLNNG